MTGQIGGTETNRISLGNRISGTGGETSRLGLHRSSQLLPTNAPNSLGCVKFLSCVVKKLRGSSPYSLLLIKVAGYRMGGVYLQRSTACYSTTHMGSAT